MDFSNVQMQSDIVLVEPVDETLDESMLILAANTADKTKLGRVKHVGPGKRSKKTGRRMPVGVAIGDKVLFGHHTGEHLCMNLDGVDLIGIREPDIMAVVE